MGIITTAVITSSSVATVVAGVVYAVAGVWTPTGPCEHMSTHSTNEKHAVYSENCARRTMPRQQPVNPRNEYVDSPCESRIDHS